MRAACVVEQEVACKLLPGFGYAFIGAQVDVLVFHALPQPFHEHVVYPPTLAIHTDFDVVVLEHLDEAFTRELTSLVGVEDIRPAILGYRYVNANRGCRLPQRFRPNPWRSTVFLQKVAFGISPKQNMYFQEAGAASGTGLVRQTVQIVASHDLTQCCSLKLVRPEPVEG